MRMYSHRVCSVPFNLSRSGLTPLLGRLYSLAAQLEAHGVLRSAGDVRVVASDLLDQGDESRTQDVQVGGAVERLKMISTRLGQAGYRRFAEDLGRVVEDLSRVRAATACT